MDHYKVLEISPSATQSEIRAAYKRLAKMYHPDVNSSPHADKLFQHISESYRILSDPAKRQQYDANRQPVTRQYRQYPPYEGARSPTSSGKRNPGSYRPYSPLKQEDIIRPYMRYAYGISWLAFALALLIAIDYLAPVRPVQETLIESYILPGARYQNTHGRPQLVFTREGTRMEMRAGEQSLALSQGSLVVEKTMIFQFPKRVILDDGTTLKPLVLLYGHLSFFPILLVIFGSLGSFLRQGIVFDFNVSVIAGVLAIITVVVISSTL